MLINLILGSLCHLQCAIPVLDGLFQEPHNMAVIELLLTMAHWHGLAKLHMHHDLLLESLDRVTKVLGLKLCTFVQSTYTAFDTKELQCEYIAHTCREARQVPCVNHQTAVSAEQQQAGEASNTTTAMTSAEHCVEENLNTTSRPSVPASWATTSGGS